MYLKIQQNYIVGDEHKNFIFRMMGKYWRQFKSKITTAIREASKRKHKARAISLVKPDNVKSKEDWDKFVKERLGAEFQVGISFLAIIILSGILINF